MINSNPDRSKSIISNHPLRKTIQKPIDIDIHLSYGNSIHDREPSTLRIFFQNIKGLAYTTTGKDYGYYLSSVSAPTSSEWQKPTQPGLASSMSDRPSTPAHAGNTRPLKSHSVLPPLMFIRSQKRKATNPAGR